MIDDLPRMSASTLSPPSLPSTPRSRVLAAGAAAACLVLLGTITFAAHIDRRHARQEVERTLQVLAALRGTSGAMSEAQAHQRGFLLSRDERFLRAYEVAEAAAVQQMTRLRQLLTDQDAIRLAAQLHDVSNAEFAELDEELGGEISPKDMVKAPEHLQVQLRAAVLVDQIEAREHSLLTSRELRADRASAAVNLLAGTLVLLTAVSVAVSVRYFQHAQHLERLVTVCAWSNEIKLGEEWVTVTEYLAREQGMRVTHGISPKELARIEAELERKQGA
ncbi:CHASE3 domain-containing protein [Luteitalea sp.]